ncbi:MAG: aminotransferase class I/II-fold pyridoxal phosphate-dependent enzyme [Candidatus Rokubacteria bacterium]|nr:aminotransferase class I/II-fold pyridoxal phosphate-dependent enzyme [Candidatus Rokubacteria bacterium]
MSNGLKDLDALLEPQERLDRLIAATFRRFGPRLVDLSYANPYDGPDEEVLRALARVAAEGRGLSLQYTPYGGRVVTRRAIATRLSREYGLQFDLRDIIMTAGATAALNVVFRGLFGPEDEVIVLTPCWQDYPLYLRNLDIPTSFVALGGDKHLDLDAIGRALSRTTRGIVLSQPGCPTGVVYAKEELDGLATLLREAEARFGTSIYLISDEVHRRLVWGRRPLHSPLLSYPRSLSIYSFGKALALQGQRTGYVAVSPRMPENDEVRGTLERYVRIMGCCAPASLMQRAVCELLDRRPRVEALAENQKRVRSTLADFGYEICDAEATFFVYVKSPIRDDFRFAELLAAHAVLVVPSTLFHEPGHVRLSLTARSAAIAAGLPAFAGVLKRL